MWKAACVAKKAETVRVSTLPAMRVLQCPARVPHILAMHRQLRNDSGTPWTAAEQMAIVAYLPHQPVNLEAQEQESA